MSSMLNKFLMKYFNQDILNKKLEDITFFITV